MSLLKKAHSPDSQLLDCIRCLINTQSPPPYYLGIVFGLLLDVLSSVNHGINRIETLCHAKQRASVA